MGRLPLSNIRVLDFTLVWAGPFATMMLGDLGAEIVRVESLQHHITNTRGYIPWPKTREYVAGLGHGASLYAGLDPGEQPWNRHAQFNSLGRNKLSMTADITRPEGQAVVHELVKTADILIENNMPGMMRRFNLDYSTLRRLNPSLIYVTMPIFGRTGPYKDYMGWGTNAEGIAGLYALRGYEGDTPEAAPGSNHMDASSGVAAAYACLMALLQRRRTGKGMLVEVSQVEHMIHQIGSALMDAAMNGRDAIPLGDRDAVRAPQGVYPCTGDDAWVAISVGTDSEWAGLCRAIGDAHLSTDPRYVGNAARQARHSEIDAIISRWTQPLSSREAMTRLQQQGVPAGMVSSDKDVFEDPQLLAHGFFHPMNHADCGSHRYPGHSYRSSKLPLRFETPAPLLGEHNDYVYKSLLAKTSGEVARLKAEGHIGDCYVPDVE